MIARPLTGLAVMAAGRCHLLNRSLFVFGSLADAFHCNLIYQVLNVLHRRSGHVFCPTLNPCAQHLPRALAAGDPPIFLPRGCCGGKHVISHYAVPAAVFLIRQSFFTGQHHTLPAYIKNNSDEYKKGHRVCGFVLPDLL